MGGVALDGGWAGCLLGRPAGLASTCSVSTCSLISHLAGCCVSLSLTFLICKVGSVTPGDGPSCDFCRVNRGWVPSAWGVEGHPSLRSWE